MLADEVYINIHTLDHPDGEIRGQLRIDDRADRFRRGDVNDDGEVDIADAVAALLFLFGGSITPGCVDTIDIDDDLSLAIDDPVGLLQWLFTPGAPPPAEPFPGYGVDPTASVSKTLLSRDCDYLSLSL